MKLKVNIHTKMLLILAILLCCLFYADIITTQFGLSRGLFEANPDSIIILGRYGIDGLYFVATLLSTIPFLIALCNSILSRKIDVLVSQKKISLNKAKLLRNLLFLIFFIILLLLGIQRLFVVASNLSQIANHIGLS